MMKPEDIADEGLSRALVDPECRLTWIRNVESDIWKKKRSLYRCECGTEKIISNSSVRCGLTKSCGCYNREMLSNSDRQSKRGFKGGKAIKGRPAHHAGKILIYESYSARGMREGRSKYVTEEELRLIYCGMIPDPFARC